MTATDPFRGTEEALRARIQHLERALAEAEAEIARLEQECELAERALADARQ